MKIAIIIMVMLASLELKATPPVVLLKQQIAPQSSIVDTNIIWVTNQTLVTTRNDSGSTVGCKFSTSVNLTIRRLGRWVISGSTQTHRIGLWQNDGTLLGFVTMNTTGMSTGWHYLDLTNPVVTTPFTFHIGSEEFVGGDLWYNDDSTLFTTSDISTYVSTYSGSAGFLDPSTVNLTGHCFVPVSFEYTKP